jgi:carbon monoxide dehydrogenase subunit G
VIELENEFRVPADPGAVYDFLLQLEQVGQCIPGGRVGYAGDDGAHPAEIVVKLGPMRLTYRGSVRLGGRDQAARKATLTTDVREARGQGSARARMEVKVEEEDNGARVLTRTEVQLTGRAASMGRGVIDDVAARMVDDMAACITERVGAQSAGSTAAASSPADAPSPVAASAAPPAPPAPVGGLHLMARVLWARVKRLFTRR